MSSITAQIEAIQKDIADLEKKLAYKKSLLPGLQYAARQQGEAKVEEGEGQMRLRLGNDTEEVLTYLMVFQMPRSWAEVQDGTKLATKPLRAALRNLIKRNLVNKVGEDSYVVTDSGIEFFMKYQEKQ
jgi:hypothetical protein